MLLNLENATKLKEGDLLLNIKKGLHITKENMYRVIGCKFAYGGNIEMTKDNTNEYPPNDKGNYPGFQLTLERLISPDGEQKTATLIWFLHNKIYRSINCSSLNFLLHFRKNRFLYNHTVIFHFSVHN